MNPVGDIQASGDRGPSRIPVILVTGFLGAGKTTLLLRWLKESPATGLRMGVVMNEFGAESVDSQILGRPGLPVSQVSGGCVCCAPDNELDRAVRQLARSGDCDYLVVETSGLADPDNVIDVLTDPDLLEVARLQAVVSVIDAPWYSRPDGEIGERVLARRQIEFANVLCLSKCDRLDDSALDALDTDLAAQHPRARRIRMPFGLPDIGDLLRMPPAEARVDGSDDASTDAPHLHTGYRSVTWRFPVPIDRPAFETFLSRLNPREVVRAKGFVRFRQAPQSLFLFQQVWGHHFIDEFLALPHPAQVVVLIVPHLDAAAHQAALRTLTFGADHRGLSIHAP